MKRPVIFWDVDTQHDFMDHDGKLYVPDAELIKPNLKRLTDYAHDRNIHIVASSDDHTAGDRELSSTPDFEATFPEHCMRGTRGAEKIPETALFAAKIIEPDSVPHDVLARSLWSHGGDVLDIEEAPLFLDADDKPLGNADGQRRPLGAVLGKIDAESEPRSRAIDLQRRGLRETLRLRLVDAVRVDRHRRGDVFAILSDDRQRDGADLDPELRHRFIDRGGPGRLDGRMNRTPANRGSPSAKTDS